MALNPSQPSLLPDTNIFTKPMSPVGIGDLLKLMEFQRDAQRSDAAAATVQGAAPSDSGQPPPPSGAPGAGTFPRISGGGSAGAAELDTDQPKWSALAASSSPYDDLYAAADKKYNLPSGLMKGMGYIESSHNPKAWTKGSQYRGLMQIGKDEERNYGVNVWDPASSIDGAAKIASRNQFQFRQTMGRDPTAGELYLMHQQGAAGAMALLNNPNLTAQQALQKVGVAAGLARKSISGNGGNPDAPASQFTQKWSQHPVFGRQSEAAGKTKVASAQTGTVSDARAPIPVSAQKPWDQMTEEEKWAPKQARSIEEQEAAQAAQKQKTAQPVETAAKSESGKLLQQHQGEEPKSGTSEPVKEGPKSESGKLMESHQGGGETEKKEPAYDAKTGAYAGQETSAAQKKFNRYADAIAAWRKESPANEILFNTLLLGPGTAAAGLGALPRLGAIVGGHLARNAVPYAAATTALSAVAPHLGGAAHKAMDVLHLLRGE